MAVIKHSKQRDAIHNFLMSRKDHPTAETVYANVIKEFPNISLGTVYRNLSFLVDNGMAVKFPVVMVLYILMVMYHLIIIFKVWNVGLYSTLIWMADAKSLPLIMPQKRILME